MVKIDQNLIDEITRLLYFRDFPYTSQSDLNLEFAQKKARAVLGAVAPAIEGQALRDAADAIELGPWYAERLSEYHNAEGAAESWLRARASEIEQEDT